MSLIRFDDYVKGRAARDPEFARLRYQTAIELLGGNAEDRRIALRILREQLGIADDEIERLKRNEAAV